MNKNGRDWLSLAMRYRRAISISGLIVLVALVGGIRFASSRHQSRKADFLKAAAYYAQIEGDLRTHGEALAQLQTIMARHEELHAKYDGQLAQNLLSHNQSELAEGYSQAVVQRLGDRCDFGSQFTKGTFLISERRYLDALRESIALKLALENEQREDLQGLYLYNLLRIAMLQEEAGTKESELAAWGELRKNLQERAETTSYNQLLQNFRKGNVSLLDYIDERIASLDA